MLLDRQLRGQRDVKSRVIPVQAPIGGLNTRDALDDMPPEDAVLLDNWFPSYGFCQLRRGHEVHATGVGSSNVDTIVEFLSGSTQKMIAAGSGKIYDATSTGAATELATGFSGNRWQTVTFNGTMALVNGIDAPQQYDGSTVGALTISGSGLTVANLIDCFVFNSRVWYVEKDTLNLWYTATNAIGGTLTKFDLSRVGKFGGTLLTIASITFDAGDGPDDFICFITTAGEVIVYQGTDPSSASTFGIAGRYKMGVPLDRRGLVQVGNDTMILTQSDYVPLSRIFKQGELKLSESKISGAARDAARDYGSNTGWEAILYPNGNQIIVNIPVLTGGTYKQHVQNSTTGAWCTFSGLNATTWGVFNKSAYFGKNDGKIYLYDENDNDDGANIDASGQTAWNKLRSISNKQLKAIRPLISADGDLTYSIGAGKDFESFLLATTSSAAPGSAWDTSDWDTSSWAQENIIRAAWTLAGKFGNIFSSRLNVSTKDQVVKWLQTDYTIEIGKSF